MGGSPAAADHREVCIISKYQEFDAQIFDVTKIMIGFSLTDGQKTELLKIAGEIEAACQDGSLSGDERQRLLDTMADCGLELPQPTMEPVVDEAKLREEAAAEARKCLEAMIVCEARGHLWKEKADPENGTSTLSCRRCGAEEHLRW